MTAIASRPTVLILGASYAGLLACARLCRGRTPVRIVVIDSRSHFEQKIRLHETLAGHATRRLALAPLLQKRGVEFRQARVDTMDVRARQVRLQGGEALAYDYLVYALGSVPHQHIPGSAEHTVAVHDRAQMQALHGRVRALAGQGGRVAVLGGGPTALEMITELAETLPGLQLTLVSRQTPGHDLQPRARDHLQKVLAGYRISHQPGTVQAVMPQAVVLASGEQLPFDLCLDCTGLRANPVAERSGLSVDAQGRLPVDACLRVPGHDRVFVAGDAARVEINGEPLRMACATAMPTGAHAGMNLAALLAGEPLRAFDFGYVARFTSLGRGQALTQFVDAADRPARRVATGAWAVRYKEWICKMTLLIVHWELSTGLRLYFWPGSGLRTRELVE